MKKGSMIFCYVASALVALVGLVFALLEATLLVTLDFALYEDMFIAFVQLVLRLLLASAALTLGVLSLVKRARSFLPHSICLFASSVVMIPFISNYIGICFAALAALFLLSRILLVKAGE